MREINMPSTRAWLPLLALMMTACLPRSVQVPVAYRVRADANSESLPCAKREFAELGFAFTGGPDTVKVIGQRVTRRGTRTRNQEVVRLELSGDEDARVLELAIGIATGRGALSPDALPMPIGGLASPSSRTKKEADDIMARCQASPLW